MDVDPAVFDLYNDYAHNRLTRRDFMEKLSVYAVGGLTVPALMKYVMPDYQNSGVVPADDPRLETSRIQYSSPKGGGVIGAYRCKPKDAQGKLGGIVVVHENRGLNPYIEDVARRAALEGFICVAPDMLSPLGGYPGNDDDGRIMQQQRTSDEMLEDFIAAYEYLKLAESCNGKIGVVGFCFGGWISNMMAVRLPELVAAVPYYGSQAPVEDVPKIKAALQLHFAENDTRVNAGWPDYEKALQAHHKEYTVFHYPGTNHGFHNDSTPRYHEEAAKLAWQRTIEFFKEKLQ